VCADKAPEASSTAAAERLVLSMAAVTTAMLADKCLTPRRCVGKSRKFLGHHRFMLGVLSAAIIGTKIARISNIRAHMLDEHRL
jgi:hypothetical protein